MDRGIFITFEGGEGCGKSTQIALLKKFLEESGREVVQTREPGGAPLSEKIRQLLLFAKEGDAMDARTEILLFEAARSQHTVQTVIPALQSGKVVLCDRYADSTTAYQGAARALPAEDVRALNKFATHSLEPDLTILLDVPVEEGLARANRRDGGKSDRMGTQSVAFYNAVRNSFLELARENPHRFEVVCSSGTPEETFEKIKTAVLKRLAQNG